MTLLRERRSHSKVIYSGYSKLGWSPSPRARYNPMVLTKLTKILPQIDLQAYFDRMGLQRPPHRIIVVFPKYLESLGGILQKTPPHVVQHYLVARAALTLCPRQGTSSGIWRAIRQLQNTLQGVSDRAKEDRALYFSEQVESALGFASGRFFVNETFTQNSKENVMTVIRRIIGELRGSLRKLPWMDAESADAAESKADNTRPRVGYPTVPDTMDPQSIAEYYGDVHIDRTKFFENMLSAARSRVRVTGKDFDEPRNTDQWTMCPSAANAYFSPTTNGVCRT